MKFKLFADDTQFYLSMRNVEDTERKINEVMNDVKIWMDSKQLKMNDKKTECLIVGRKNQIKKLEFESLRVLGEEFEVMRPIKKFGCYFRQ